MSNVKRRLPSQPHIDVPKREARELQELWRAGESSALERIRAAHPRFASVDRLAIGQATPRLSDALLVIAREYGFASWSELKARIGSNASAQSLAAAIRAGDCPAAVKFARQNPSLLHLPLLSGNWGPPMSHAANLGDLEIVEALAALGARDFQHAFDRAVLQGKLECARWLLANGARLEPGLAMGPCETLNAGGLAFLAGLGAPLTDAEQNPGSALAMVLQTYARNPAGKRDCIQVLKRHGIDIPDTPMMALHGGRADLLERHLQRDSTLITRRFAYREIYPPELGCQDDGRSGLHGTPLDGCTLLHLAIDFDEQEIFNLLLARGADVNATAAIDPDGFGGHTPLFNAVVSCAFLCGRQRDAGMAKALLAGGANPLARANMKKFLDWREQPGWHRAFDVTPAEWGLTFPERDWTNLTAVEILRKAAHNPGD